MKRCKKCNEMRVTEDFHKHSRNKDGLATWCKECKSTYDKQYASDNAERISKRQKDWRIANAEVISDKKKRYYRDNPERSKERTLKHLYGITIEQYDAMLKQQNDCCAICERTNDNGYALSIDHDHNCCPGKKSCGKCIRQLLCNSCNAMIGHAKEDVSILQKAIEYIQENQPSGLIA